MSKRLIYAEDAIDALHDEIVRRRIDEDTYDDGALDEFDTEAILRQLPPAQPEQSPDVQGILEYLDTVLHPIISPEHWNIYSELYDMISALPPAQPETHEKRTETHGVCLDAISRQDAIDEAYEIIIDGQKFEVVQVETLMGLPSVQPEPAIPLSWIEGQIEWLKSLDNAFSTLTAGQILAMMNKWKDEQDG